MKKNIYLKYTSQLSLVDSMQTKEHINTTALIQIKWVW